MTNNQYPSVFIFWTARTAPLSRLTIRVTGRRLPDKSDAWAHMGLGFDLDPGVVYYECLFHDGFTGPKPFHKLFNFALAGGRLGIRAVPGLSPADVAGIKDACDAWVGKKGYYAWQLAMMWAFERLGIRVPPSPDRLVCSEAVARLLYPWLDLRDEHRDFDAVNPNSAYRSFLQITKQKESPA